MSSNRIWHFIMLSLLISFGSVGVVCITPGMPGIGRYFHVNDTWLGFTISFYLFGYAFGQLIYGALTNKFGGKFAINIGVLLTVIGCIGIILSYYFKNYWMLLLFRVVMAFGAASGLKMTFTLVHKLFLANNVPRILGFLTISFAIIPGLAVYVSGELVEYFNWTSPFYIMILFALIIFLLNQFLPTICTPIKSGLNILSIIEHYVVQFKSKQVVFGGLLLGIGSCFVYVFSTLAPLIAMSVMGLSPDQYGSYNLITVAGIFLGSFLSNIASKTWLATKSLKCGLLIIIIGVLILSIFLLVFASPLSLFLPMVIIYIGLSFIFGNSSALALKHVVDVSNASAVMSFINIFSAVALIVLISQFNTSNIWLLPAIFIGLCFLGILWFVKLNKIVKIIK